MDIAVSLDSLHEYYSRLSAKSRFAHGKVICHVRYDR